MPAICDFDDGAGLKHVADSLFCGVVGGGKAFLFVDLRGVVGVVEIGNSQVPEGLPEGFDVGFVDGFDGV